MAADRSANAANKSSKEAHNAAEKAEAEKIENTSAGSLKTVTRNIADKVTKANEAAQQAKMAANHAQASEHRAASSDKTAQDYYGKIEESGLVENGKTAIGYGANASGRNSSALGNSTTASADHSAAVGHSAKASAVRSTAVGHNAQALGVNSVALGADSVADEADVVSVGNAKMQRRVTNLVDARQAHDAVNLKQLNEVKNSIGDVRADLRKTDKRLRGGIAGSSAIAGLPQVNDAGVNAVAVSVGYIIFA